MKESWGQDEERIGRWLARAWLGLCLLFIVLVSLLPMEVDVSKAHLLREGRFFLYRSLRQLAELHLVGDLASNFLLYLPLGLLVPWVFIRRRWLGLVLGPLLSLLLETAQLAARNRTGSLTDCTMNTLGFLVGYALMRWIALRYRLSGSLFLGVRAGTERRALARALRALYVSLLLLSSLIPFELSFKMHQIWVRMAASGPVSGRIYLDLLAPWPQQRAWSFLACLLLFVPYGFLSLLGRPRLQGAAVWRYCIRGLLLACAVELLQVFVRTRVCDVAHVLAGGVGAGVGVLLALLWERHAHGEPAPAGQRPQILGDVLLLAMFGYGLFLMMVSLRPFHLLPSVEAAWFKLAHESNWMPFWPYYARRSLGDWRDVGQELSLFVPLGMLLGAWLRRRLGRHHPLARLGVAVAVLVVLGSGLELSQALIVERYVDINDMISHGLGGLLGFGLGSLLSGAERHPPAAPAN